MPRPCQLDRRMAKAPRVERERENKRKREKRMTRSENGGRATQHAYSFFCAPAPLLRIAPPLTPPSSAQVFPRLPAHTAHLDHLCTC